MAVEMIQRQSGWLDVQNANNTLLKNLMTIKTGKLSDVATTLNGVAWNSGGGGYSLIPVDAVNRIGLLIFATSLDTSKVTVTVAGYTQFNAFTFNASVFKSTVANAGTIGMFNFNGWGTTNTLTYTSDHTVGFTNNSNSNYDFSGGANVGGAFLVTY